MINVRLCKSDSRHTDEWTRRWQHAEIRCTKTVIVSAGSGIIIDLRWMGWTRDYDALEGRCE